MKALVIGAGRSGIGASLLLNQQGYDVLVVNDGPFEDMETLDSLGIKYSTLGKNYEPHDDFEVVVKNPGIPNTHTLVSKYTSVLNEIEIAYRNSPNYKYYAISGANGKTTTTSILGAMLLRKNPLNKIAGNIGIALSQVVYETGDQNIDVALEISAFQMEGTPSFSPEVYALTNLTPDHLDRYESVEEYYQQKLSVIPRAKVFIRNIDDSNIKNRVEKTDTMLDISIYKKADIHIHNNKAYFKEQVLFDVDDIKLVGKHNIMNMLMASAIAYLANVSIEDIQEVVKNFTGVEHRLEYVDTIDDVKYYNDSKSTNPESLEVCLASFDTPIILLAGGYDKHVSFKNLAKYQSIVKHAYLFGDSKTQIKNEAFKDAILCEDMQDAYKLAQNELDKGDIVVLSPGCASYDQFENFEQRGTIYKEMVKNSK